MSLSFRRVITSASFCLLSLALTASGVRAQVLISQLYTAGGSGAAGTTFNYDYIELFNNGSTAVNLTGYSVQYASAAGAFNSIFALNGTIAPNNYFLLQTGNPGSAGNGITPAADQTGGTLNMSATAGKVVLATNTTAATFAAGSNSTATLSANVADFVGYGATASAYYGAGAAPAPGSNSNSIARVVAAGTAVNTNNNNADFMAQAVLLHNSMGVVSAATPEPGSLALAGIGALSLTGALVRRRRAK